MRRKIVKYKSKYSDAFMKKFAKEIRFLNIDIELIFIDDNAEFHIVETSNCIYWRPLQVAMNVSFIHGWIFIGYL